MEIYHNPRCAKSREALQILRDKGQEPQIIEYLKDIPSESELKTVLKKLGIQAEDLIRKQEKIFKENYKGKELSNDEWVKAMVSEPKLIERPIVIKGEKAVVGRPPERVLELL